MQIVQPRFVAIDSSILASWAKAAFSPDSKERQLSRSTVDSLLNANWILVLSLHHFEELVRHPNLEIAGNRIAFLRALPCVAWVRNLVEPDHLGSISDVFDAEVKALSMNDDLDLPRLVNLVRQDVFRCTTGMQIATLDLWRDFHPLLMAMAVHEQEIASVIHTPFTVPEKIEIAVLESGKMPDRQSMLRSLRTDAVELARQLADRGDRRLKDTEHIARKYD